MIMNNIEKVQKNSPHDNECIESPKDTQLNRWIEEIYAQLSKQREVVEVLGAHLEDVRNCYPVGSEEAKCQEEWGNSQLAQNMQRIHEKISANTEKLLYICDTLEIK